MTDPNLVAYGHAAEDAVARRAISLGWTVEIHGSRAHETTPVLLAAITRSRHPIRHAPDLVVARGDLVAYVEVVRCDPARHVHRCVEVAKLTSLDRWSLIAPIVVVDVGDWLAWWHRPGWADDMVTDASTRTITGSGDAFGWFPRTGVPFDVMFGGAS